jgi:hypothetical protein
MDDSCSSQAAMVLPVGKVARAGGQRGAVLADDLLGQQGAEHFGGVPPLRLGDGQHLGGNAAHVRQPHPPQQASLSGQRGGQQCRNGQR